ncbi:hypothetical protein [Aulosira sp. FACHB-615]|uniref:hypothetical protein n=1 Tax=Aulosira sp. FACHB-615 TaxID=2692777 RepID=UPI0016873DEC|nr:hypothetical protein [Aulosira sp. FACHB-615]MBD2492588.1 hypothetical protein [Aulosira sp. FACHB-615]
MSALPVKDQWAIITKDLKLPKNWQEKDLQQAITSRLREHGFQARCESGFQGGYADIVTDWQDGTVIEIKKYLDRKRIYEAYGQLNLYCMGNDYKMVIAGFMHPFEQRKTRAIASMIERNPLVQVLFI